MQFQTEKFRFLFLIYIEKKERKVLRGISNIGSLNKNHISKSQQPNSYLEQPNLDEPIKFVCLFQW